MGKKNKKDELYQYGPDGSTKTSYSFLESEKRNLSLWKKIFIVAGILASLGLVIFLGWLSKNFG